MAAGARPRSRRAASPRRISSLPRSASQRQPRARQPNAGTSRRMPGPAPPRSAKVRAALGAVRHDTLAGLLDASLASLATFVVGIYAVRAFDPVTLGGY